MASSYSILIAGLGDWIEGFLVPVLAGQGYHVATSVGVADTLAAVAEPFDLALIDLPTESELAYLRDARERCHCAMIVIGPPRNDRLLVASLECGADDYVQRPFRTDELMARVRAQLRRSTRDRSTGA